VLEYKTDMHERQKQFEEEAKVTKLKRNPFNAKINEQSLQNATKMKERRESATKRMFQDMDTFARGFGESQMAGGGGMMMDEDMGGDDIANKL